MRAFKKSIIAIVAALSCVSLSACNKDIFDFNYTFDKAIVSMNGKAIELDIDQWTDYEDGEQLQLRLRDGSVILVSSYNTILVQTNGRSESEVYKLVTSELEKAEE